LQTGVVYGSDIVSAYTYNEIKTQFNTHPYGLFAVDLDVWYVPVHCQIPVNPVSGCVTGSGNHETSTDYPQSDVNPVPVPVLVPVFSSAATFNSPENQTAVGTVVADPVDSYSIVSGNDGAAFSINAITGVLTFVSAPDFEVKNSYSLTVRATKNAQTADQGITVSVTNVVESTVITLPTQTTITDTTATVGATLDCKGLSTVWSIEYGTTNLYGSTKAGGTTSSNGAVTTGLTGLPTYTLIYWRLKAVNSDGTVYSDAQTLTTLFTATLTATGTGAGVTIFRLEVSEDQTLAITSGTGRFYTDAAGTLGESTTWALTTGAIRTIYLKAASGSSVLNIPKPDRVVKWGNTVIDGWVSSTNAASIGIVVGKLALTELRITGNSVLSGALPAALTFVVFLSNLIVWPYSGAMPTGLTTLYLFGNSIAWTGLDIGNNGNISTLSLLDYRITKMSSPDMITLLTQMTNRTGTLPATVTINDYADFAAPPVGVTNAVTALKAAKSITTVNLGA